MERLNLLILGATGKTGHLVREIAGERGHRVTAVARPGSVLDNREDLTVISGSVLDPATMREAMKNQDAVISCLGLRRRAPSNPWSSVVSPPDLCARAAQITIDAMTGAQVFRVVAMSAAGVGDSWPNMSRLERVAVRASRIAVSYRDFNEMERAFAQCPHDCLMVRPVKLSDDSRTADTAIVDRCKPRSLISRYAVATWLVDAVERPARFDTFAEMIGERGSR